MSSGNLSSGKQLERDLWMAKETDDPETVLHPSPGMLCRMLLMGVLTIIACLVGVASGVWLSKNDSIITVPDATTTLDIYNCYVTTDPASLKSTNEHADISGLADKASTITVTGRDSGLCALRLRIPTTRTAKLTIRATASTIILADNDVDYACIVEIKSLDEARGTLRMQVGGAGFVGLNVSVPDGILIINTRRLLPTHINARLDWGVVSFPASSTQPFSTTEPPKQKTIFNANVSLGGYCIETGSYLSVWLYDDRTWNNTIAYGTIYPSTSASVTRTSTVVVNASSVYIMTSGVTQKSYGAMMNETQRMRPYVVESLLKTRFWLSQQTNKMFIQAVDVVAPYAGALFLNTGSAFMLSFGVELMSLLSGFMLVPSYRRVSSTLNHYQCNARDTMISDISTGVLMAPLDASSIGTTTVDASTKVYVSDQTIASVYDAIENATAGVATTTAVGLVSLELTRTVRPDTILYSIGVALDGSVLKHVIRRDGGQWALFAFSLFIGFYVAVACAVLCWYYRFQILRAVYLQDSRAFVREATQMRHSKKCPYWNYFSLYSVHALLSFHLVRLVNYVVYATFPEYMTAEFANWVLKIIDNERDGSGGGGAQQGGKGGAAAAAAAAAAAGAAEIVNASKSPAMIERGKPRLIPVSQLVDKYATWAARRYMPRIDLPRPKFIRVLQERTLKISTQRLRTVVGIAFAALNTERGGQYVFNELYRTTGTEFDVVPAAAVANELFAENPLLRATEQSVVEEAEALLLPIGEAMEPAVTNATWSGMWLLETASVSQAETAERAFASFPSAMEVRPSMSWPKIPEEGYGAVRDEIKVYFFQMLMRLVLAVGQGIFHTAVVAAPFAVGTALMSMYVRESVKYSVTNHFLDGFEVFFAFNFIANLSLTIDFANVQLAMTVASLCFIAFAVLEPMCLISFRLCTRDVTTFERVVMWPITSFAICLWLIAVLVVIAFVICVLIWWILAAIVAPETMLAFASSAICLLGALGTTYRSVVASRDSIVDRVKERILEFLIDFLKKSGVNVDAAGANSMFGVEGINVDLLIDVADGKVEALEKLASILKIPAPILTSANAVNSKDPEKMRQSSDALLKLIDVPAQYHDIFYQVLLRAAGVPSPMSQLTYALYKLHPDPAAQAQLRKADYIVIQCLEAILNPDLLDLTRVMNALVATGTEFLIEQSVEHANKLIAENKADVKFITEDMVITRAQCKAVIDWVRVAVSKVKQQLNSDGSVLDDAGAQVKMAARRYKEILAKLKELLTAVAPLMNADQNTIASVVIGAIEMCMGGESASFSNALIAAGDKLLRNIDFCPNSEVLLLVYTIVSIDPAFKSFIETAYAWELQMAGVDVNNERAKVADAKNLWDYDDYEDEEGDQDDDDDDAGSEGSVSPRNKDPGSPGAGAGPVAKKKDKRAFLHLVEHVVHLLTGVMKLTTRLNEQRFITTLLQVCFSEEQDAVKLIDVLAVPEGASGARISAAKTYADAKRAVELLVQSVMTDKRVRSATQKELAAMHPVAKFIAFHWISIAQLVAPVFKVDEAIQAEFRPDYNALKKITDISKSSLQCFEHAAALGLYVSNLVASQISGAIGISAADIFEIVKGALSTFAKLLPQAASGAEGIFGSAKAIIAKISPDLAAQMDAAVPSEVHSGLALAKDAPGQLARAQGAAYAKAQAAAASSIASFPSLLFRLLRGAAPSFGPGSKSKPTSDEVAEAKRTGSFSLSMLAMPDFDMPDVPFAQLARTLYSMMTKVGKLVMSTVLAGANMPKSLLCDTDSVFEELGQIVMDQVYSFVAPDVKEAVLEWMQLMTQAGRPSQDQLNRLAKKLGVNTSQIKMLFVPAMTLVGGVCPWAVYLYRLANASFVFSANDPMFKLFVEQHRADFAGESTEAFSLDKNKAVSAKDAANNKRFNLAQYLAHFAPATDSKGNPKPYVEFMSHEVIEMQDSGDGEVCGHDTWNEAPMMWRFPLRYPAFSKERERRTKKNGLLFCVMVTPHPVCFEAIFLTDLLDAIRGFFNDFLPDGCLRPGHGGFVDVAVLVTPEAAAAAAAAAATAGGPSSGGNDPAAAAASAAAAAAAPAAGERTVESDKDHMGFLERKWLLLMDMIATTMPTLAQLAAERGFADKPTTRDWIQALEVILVVLHNAAVLESPEIELDEECKIKPFKKTREFQSWEKIARAGLDPKPNYGTDAQKRKWATQRKGRKEAGGEPEPADETVPQDGEYRALWEAFALGNPFRIFEQYDNLSQGAFASALVFFNRCHGLPEVKIDMERVRCSMQQRQFEALNKGRREEDYVGWHTPDDELPKMEVTMEEKALKQMGGLAAFATLLCRRTDLPASAFSRLLKRVPAQSGKVISDLLALRCGGMPFVSGDDMRTTLSAFPALTKEFRKMNLDQFGAHIVDLFTLLHGRANGFMTAQALGGLGDMSRPVRQLEARREHVAKQLAASGGGGLKRGLSNLKAGDALSDAAKPGARAAQSEAGSAAEGARAAGGAAVDRTGAFKEKHGGAVAHVRERVGQQEQLDMTVLKRFAMLIVRGDTLSVATAFMLHATRLFKDTVSADFSFFKSLLLVLFAADELDLSKLTDDIKAKYRDMKAAAVKAFADPGKKLGGAFAKAAAGGGEGGGARARFAGLAAKALAQEEGAAAAEAAKSGEGEGDDADKKEHDEEEWEEVDEEYWEDEEMELPLDGDGDPILPPDVELSPNQMSAQDGGSGSGNTSARGGGGGAPSADAGSDQAPHFQGDGDGASPAAVADGGAAATAGSSGTAHHFDDDGIEETVLDDGDGDKKGSGSLAEDGTPARKKKVMVRVKKTKQVRRKKEKGDEEHEPDHDNDNDSDAEKKKAAAVDINFDLTGVAPTLQDLSGYSPFLFALLNHVTEGGLDGACKTFDAALEPLLSVLKNPVQALLDICPFGADSKEWQAMSLALSLVMSDWDTAMLCVKKLVVSLGAPPGLQKLVNIILRTAATAMSQKDEDKVQMAKDVACDVLDLAADDDLAVDEIKPYKPVFRFATRLLREEPMQVTDYNEIITFAGEHVLSRFLPEDLVPELVEFAQATTMLIAIFTNPELASMLGNATSEEFDAFTFIGFLLECKLLVPKEYREQVETLKDFLEGRVMPIRRRAAQALKDGETATSLMAKVQLPMLMEFVTFAAKAASSAPSAEVDGEVSAKERALIRRAVPMPDDVSTKIVLIAKLMSGDLDALGPVLEALGAEVPEEMIGALKRVLQLVKTLGAHKDLGEGGAVAQQSFINALTDFVFDQFSNGSDTISFNAMMAMLDRMHMSMPAAEARTLFAEVDQDDSGAIDREEFKHLIAKLQEMLFNRVLDFMGMSPQQLIIVLVALGVNLVLILAFLLLGVRTFADGTAFTASTSALLPFFATAASKVEGTLDQLVVQADKAVAELMSILNSRAD